MMRTAIVLSLMASMTLFSSYSWAQKRTRPLPNTTLFAANPGGPDKEVSLSGVYGEFASASGTNGLKASLNYKKFVHEGMEAGGRVDLMMVDYKGTSNTYIGLWGTFTYNFHPMDLANTYYVTGALGFVDEALAGAPVGTSDKKFSFAAYGGRRFPWMDKLYYTPEVGLRKIGSTDMAIVIVPLNVSVLW